MVKKPIELSWNASKHLLMIFKLIDKWIFTIMEPDRYEQNKIYYVIGFVCLIISLWLLGVGIYLLPYIAFGWVYNIPDAVFERIDYIQITYDLTWRNASWLVLIVNFFVCFLFALVAYFTSNRIDNEILGIKPEPAKVKKETKESYQFILTILMTVGLIFLVAMLFQWIISSR